MYLCISHDHAEAKFVVFVGVIDLGGEHEGEARVQPLLEEGAHHLID